MSNNQRNFILRVKIIFLGELKLISNSVLVFSLAGIVTCVSCFCNNFGSVMNFAMKF